MTNTESTRNSNKTKLNITTIILADDHPIVRQALRNEIEKEADFQVLAEAVDGEEAVSLVTELRPNVVIMDIGMPRLNGIEATRQIKCIYHDTMVLVLTVYDDIEHILEILESGADGYLTKNVMAEEIVQAVRSIIGGEIVLSPEVFGQVLKYALRHNIKPLTLDTGTKLTVREQEILILIAQGMSNKQIAEKLEVGIRTVKSHLVDIYTKLKVFSRTEAVMTSLRAGFFKLDDLH
jgi:NarL family two-component system response regulator LiaR